MRSLGTIRTLVERLASAYLPSPALLIIHEQFRYERCPRRRHVHNPAFRRTPMKSIVRISAVVMGVAIGSTIAGPAGAAQGPSNKCYGEIVSGIASTWPWAHNDKVDFPPPPGALALWIQEFGPFVGISSVRELQVAFCDEQ